jgi:hypothetical protein
MAQRVVVLTECDKHQLDKDESVPGAEWTFTYRVPGGRLTTRVVDVCADCAGPLGDAVALLISYGRTAQGGRPNSRAATTPEPEPVAPGVLSCSECDYTTPPDLAKPRNALADHGRRKHDKSLAELLGEPLDYVCPECQRPFSTPQGLAIHRGRTEH